MFKQLSIYINSAFQTQVKNIQILDGACLVRALIEKKQKKRKVAWGETALAYYKAFIAAKQKLI